MLRVLFKLTAVVIEISFIDIIGIKEGAKILLGQTMKMIAKSLQVRLPLRKERLAILWHLLRLIKAVGVGELQEFAALNEYRKSLLKEDQLVRRVVLVVTEELDFFQNFNLLLLSQLARLIVIHVSLIMKRVARQVGRCPGAHILRSRKFRVFLRFFVLIALVIAAS